MKLKRFNSISPFQKMDLNLKESELTEISSSAASIQLLQKLRKATVWPTTIVQFSGYFPFHVNGVNGISISYLGVNFLNLVIQSVFGTACAIFCIYHADMTAQMADDWSATEKFAYGMVFNIISLSKVVIRLCSLVKGREIQRFQDKVNSALTAIFLTFLSSGDLGAEGNMDQIGKYLDGARKPLRYIWGLLIALEAFVLPLMVVLALRFSSRDMDYSAEWRSLVMFAMALCTFTGALYMTFIYWLVAILQCLEVGFKVLGKNLLLEGWSRHNHVTSCPADDGNSKGTSWREDEMSWFMSSYTELEECVHDFNSTFKYHISINLLGCCTSWVLHTFILVSSGIKEGLNFGICTMVLWVLLDSAGIISICNASCQLTNEAKSSMNKMRDVVLKNLDSDVIYAIRAQIHLDRIVCNPVWVSPGHYFYLNRPVIISIAAVMITYVFVVLQFQDAETRIILCELAASQNRSNAHQHSS